MNKIYYNQGFPTNNSKETYCVSIDGNQIHNEEELQALIVQFQSQLEH